MRVFCLVFVLILCAHPAHGQFLSHLDIGLSARSGTPTSTIHKTVFEPAKYWSLSIQTPFHAGVVGVDVYRHPLRFQSGDADPIPKLHASMFWKAVIPVWNRFQILPGIGTGAERYDLTINGEPFPETEILFKGHLEAQFQYKSVILFTDATYTRVLTHHRLDVWSVGTGVRLRILIPDDLRRSIL